MPILTALLAILSGFASFLGEVTDVGKELLFKIWDAVWNLIRTFLDHAPRPLTILVFLFLLVTFGNLFSKVFLGVQYACLSTGQLYEAPDIITGLTTGIRINFFDWSVDDVDSYITENYDFKQQKADVVNVRCGSDIPKLYFYSIDILSYRLWILLLFLIYGAPIALAYYSKMGVLH